MKLSPEQELCRRHVSHSGTAGASPLAGVAVHGSTCVCPGRGAPSCLPRLLHVPCGHLSFAWIDLIRTVLLSGVPRSVSQSEAVLEQQQK